MGFDRRKCVHHYGCTLISFSEVDARVGGEVMMPPPPTINGIIIIICFSCSSSNNQSSDCVICFSFLPNVAINVLYLTAVMSCGKIKDNKLHNRDKGAVFMAPSYTEVLATPLISFDRCLVTESI